MKEKKITNEAEAKEFIKEKKAEIKKQVGKGKAICFVSGGVDSSVVAVMGWHALGDRNFDPVIIENGLMREGEIASVRVSFSRAGIPLRLVDASDLFFDRLEHKILPLDKRTAIRRTFYDEVLFEMVKKSGAKFFFQGTIRARS